MIEILEFLGTSSPAPSNSYLTILIVSVLAGASCVATFWWLTK